MSPDDKNQTKEEVKQNKSSSSNPSNKQKTPEKFHSNGINHVGKDVPKPKVDKIIETTTNKIVSHAEIAESSKSKETVLSSTPDEKTETQNSQPTTISKVMNDESKKVSPSIQTKKQSLQTPEVKSSVNNDVPVQTVNKHKHSFWYTDRGGFQKLFIKKTVCTA